MLLIFCYVSYQYLLFLQACRLFFVQCARKKSIVFVRFEKRIVTFVSSLWINGAYYAANFSYLLRLFGTANICMA